MTEAELLDWVGHIAKELRSALRIADHEVRAFGPQAGPACVFPALDHCLEQLATSGLWGAANRLPSGKLWEIAGEWLQHGALLNRARFKPRGYAGDEVMLRQICETWHCDHVLGRWFDEYFQSHAAPKAVRNRTRLVAAAIVDKVRQSPGKPVHVVSVGSGPAMDLLWACEALSTDERRQLRVRLLDLDPLALEEAAGRLAPWLAPKQITTQRENLYRLPKLADTSILQADIISCTGFFDYLADVDATDLLALFWQRLLPGGRLLVFNFAPQNSSRALMEWIGNWYLIYRDEGAMKKLATAAGLARESFRIAAEAEGIDLYIDACQPCT